MLNLPSVYSAGEGKRRFLMRSIAVSPRSCHLRSFALFLGLLIPIFCTAQVYRCIVKGQVVYQQNSCESSGSQGQEVHIDPPPESAGRYVSPVTPPPSSEPVVPPVAIEQPAPTAQPRLDPKSQRCVDWYLQRLGLPFSYVRTESLEKGVLTLTIAVPGPKGWFSRKAACEFKGEALDDGWTQEHAKRLGW